MFALTESGSQPWGPECLVYVDRRYDRQHASDGRSRFGAYLAQRIGWLKEDSGTPVSSEEFAAAVWTVATPPVMSPGYVRIRPDVHSINAVFDDGTLCFALQIPLAHSDLRPRVPSELADWSCGMPRPSGYAALDEPPPTRPALLTTALLRLPVDDSWGLCIPRHTAGPDLVREAMATIDRLVVEINNRAAYAVATATGDA